jgi:hypothetical protein
MTTPATTEQTESTYVASERGLMIAVLVMIILGAGAVLMVLS